MPTTPPILPTEENEPVILPSPNEVCGRLKKAVVTISLQCKSSLRAIVDQYIPCISPMRVDDGDSEFPMPLRTHVVNSDRSNRGNMVGNVLCFYIGNAIVAYYNATDPENRIHAVACVELLEEIAARGLDAFQVAGSDSQGYYLTSK